MSDPAVCGFITKTLCAHGGQLGLPELQQYIGLSAQQLEQTLLAAGPQHFLVLRDGGGARVLAVSDVRMCVRRECRGCERLHLCKQHLMGRCNLGSRSCKYSHDILSAENKKILKTYELSSLDENELRVLLLQNDPFFLPDACQFYNRKDSFCNQQNNCYKLHICGHFLRGECRFLPCKRSHSLLKTDALRVLGTAGIDQNIASNIQTICDHKHMELNKELKKGRIPSHKPRENVLKKPAVWSRELTVPSQTAGFTLHMPPSDDEYLGSSSGVPGQSPHLLPTGAGGKDKGTGAGGKDTGSSSGVPGQSQHLMPTGAGLKGTGSSSGVPGQSQHLLPTGAGLKGTGSSSGVPGQSQHLMPTGPGLKGTGSSSSVPGQSQHLMPTGAGLKGTGSSSSVPGQSQHLLPTGPGFKDKDKIDNAFAKTSKDNKEDKCEEICLFYLWKYCKNNDKCSSVHYHLPYRWQVFNGTTWNDLSMMEEVEKAYCDPKNSGIAHRNIDFQTMTCCGSLLRRLSTPSSVSKPSFVLTTEWIWYWKNDLGQWIEYGEEGEGSSVKSPSSAIFENLYLADPDTTISFQAGVHHYSLNFKEMVQTNIAFKTKRWVCRRPKFVSSEDVKMKKCQKDSSIPNQACPVHWDKSALPEFGYKAVEIGSVTSEYNRIKEMFQETMQNYRVLKIERIQNPSLWKVFQWQKDQMRKENGGKEVCEKLLFHGTKKSFVESICLHNFDWRICGSNGTNYGKGSYFSRDASYSHAYCQPEVKTNTMVVARVLVGEYIRGNAAYVRPPPKSAAGLRFYDSCVDNVFNPSIFVIFEKHQIYPEYLIQYRALEQKCIVS